MRTHEGHINYALVSRSKRLQKVVDLLKQADYPLSGFEIQLQAWVTNASTSIAEIRGERNMADGYLVSAATTWKGGEQPWQDGNPRYFLIAAPGWSPRWMVTPEGVLVPYTAAQGQEQRIDRPRKDAPPGVVIAEREVRPPAPAGPRLCRYQHCRQPLPDDAPPEKVFCTAECRDGFWKMIREAGKAAMGA